ncbi:DUF6431 domain-containing protein [Streptomyces sp. BE20]|uniref:DUF6431 domain-containing protein n=1 Tax=Streptomyces sp. BE20 TaxID=3002525 RepID=UPI002E79BEB5|nr:DUF6431 domain-containing protein [Streptomyces sp. BE20]MEE1822221.1 DUF6431 domain-containing protein [Streptomyces sp. BE20]
MLIEVLDAAAARRAPVRRLPRCPDYGGALRPWGRARSRTVRDLGGQLLTVRPDRARCTACPATHVVLDAALLPGRAYTVHFVGQALLGAARGRGHRTLAAELDAPESTVRGWLRRARRLAHQLWTVGVQAVVALDPAALPTLDRPTPLASAVEALIAAALAVGRRLGGEGHGLWQRIAVLTRGRLLAMSPSG